MGIVNSKFDVHLFTPHDGLLPLEDFIEGPWVTRIAQDLFQNFLRAFGKSTWHGAQKNV